jgi:TrmH family RNA methyltransferase
MITSKQNPKIKLIRALYQRKQREEQGLFVVEGIRHVGEALEAGAQIEYIIVAPELLHGEYADRLRGELKDQSIPVFEVDSDVFHSAASKENPQGILAVVQQKHTQLKQVTPDNFPWGVAIVAPQDAGNVGSILRTIDAVGASGLILLDGGVDPFHPVAVRASMGALFHLPVIHSSFEEFKQWADYAGYSIYGSSAKADTRYDQVDYQRPAILLLGSEREGLSDTQMAICDQVVCLPMRGKTTSLNLSIAAGVLLYAMMK